ncbi:MAG: ABC transporter permease [Chloroflexi bacterium]|nr:ABC transporter permease [Chloroflexota bacterium]
MQEFFSIFNTSLVESGIRLATPIILAALAGAICNRAGVLNFALEGMMLLGSFLGIISAYFLGNTYLGVLMAILAGSLLGVFFAFLYLKYNVDLVILAIAINMLVTELTVYFMRIMFGQVGTWTDSSIVKLPDIQLPLIKDIPVLGEVLSGYNIIIYFTWFAIIAAYIMLFHTKFGRHIRAVGENQSAAESVGINAPRVKMFALVISGALAALGGAFLSVGHLTMFTREMSNGRGWIGITAALFGLNHPIGVLFTGLFFGFADAFAVRLQNVTDIPPNLIQLLPHITTLLVLVIMALREKVSRALVRRRSVARIREGLVGRAANGAGAIESGESTGGSLLPPAAE